MSETAHHTPGPWTAMLSQGRKVLCVQSDDTWICGEMLNIHSDFPDQEAWANARLIAAAPEMLTALKNVNRLIAEAAATGFNWKDGDWAERLFASQQATSTAIRNAEGRALQPLVPQGEPA